jgi:hypothetical protein
VIAAIDTQTQTTSPKAKSLIKSEIKSPAIPFAAASILNQISSVAVLDEPLPFVPDVIMNHIAPIAFDKVALREEAPKEDAVLTEIRQMKEMMNKLALRTQQSNVGLHQYYLPCRSS